MIEIIPAIMPDSLADFTEKAGFVYKKVKTIHLDVMDGSITHSVNWPFVGDGLKEIEKITTGEMTLPHWTEVNYELDIMMDKPEDSIADWVNAGFRRVIVHFENTQRLSTIISEWKGVVEIGVAVGIETPNDEVYKYIDEGIDFIQFMGIFQIGFQGNPFDVRVLEKIQKAREVYPNIPISVDGSVNMETAPQLIAAGANRLVVGSAIFKAQSDKAPDFAMFDTGDMNGTLDMVNVSNPFTGQSREIEQTIDAFKKLGA